MIIESLARITSARHAPAAIARVAHESLTSACGKMPGGEGIAYLIFGAYLLYVVLAFVVAIVSAALLARKSGANRARIWAIHLTVALVATAGPLVYLYIADHIANAMAQAQIRRDATDFSAWIAKIEFRPGQVSHTLDTAIVEMPNNRDAALTLETKAFERLQASDAEWTPEDLDAFASLTQRAEAATKYPVRGRINLIPVIVTWDRQRENLAAADAVCDPSSAMSRTCRGVLLDVVRKWCSRNEARCGQLLQEPKFRDAAIKLGVYPFIAVDPAGNGVGNRPR